MKILLVEDDQYTSQVLSATLCSHHYAVDAIADGSAGLDLASRWNYDLILLDVGLPGLNGVEVCRRLRHQGCQTPILMLTVKDSSADIVTGLDAGADDYVAKSCDSTQLLARVRALLRRGCNRTSSPVLTWGSLCLDPSLAQVTYAGQKVSLRPKEYTLLELFLRHPRRILTRSTIIDHLWSLEEAPVEGSVTNLIKDLRRRLRCAGLEEDLIETVYGIGYRLRPVPAADPASQQPSDLNPASAAIARLSREQRGHLALQQATERFRLALSQRIGELETIERSLHAGTMDLYQRQRVCHEIHKLAGGLGTFGYLKASQVACSIEALLETETYSEHLPTQLSHLLTELKQAIVEPLAYC